MRRAKTSVLWTLGALLLSTLAAVIFLATADDDFYRWAMQQAIEGTIDREIRVDGSFSFDVGLEPTLIVTDVSIENAPWADKKQMARAARVEVQIELEELFSGTIRIPRLVVEDLDLYLETNGENNWEVAGVSSEEDTTAAQEGLIYPLFELVSLDPIEVEFHLAEVDAARVRVGLPIDVRLAPYPDEVFRATVSVVSPTIDSRTRTLRVKGLLLNPERRLYPGLFARVDLGIDRRTGVAMVPEEAVLQRADGAVVFRVVEANRVERVVVEIGIIRDGWVEIVRALRPGEVVIQRGHADLIDGSVVAAREADPGAILAAANHNLCADNEAGMFVTAVCGVLDLGTGDVSFSLAGHDPPVFVPVEGDPEPLQVEGGRVLGLIAGSDYPVNRLRLGHRETVVLYTDGVSEAQDVAGGFFEMERIVETVRRHRHEDAIALTDGLLEAVRSFAEVPRSRTTSL